MLATLTGALGLSAGLCVGGLKSAAPIALRCHTRLCAQEDPLRTSPAATLVSSVFKAGEGKEIYLGLLTRDVDSTTVPTPADSAARRAAAADDLVNISPTERERRRVVGLILALLTAALGERTKKTRYPLDPYTPLDQKTDLIPTCFIWPLEKKDPIPTRPI